MRVRRSPRSPHADRERTCGHHLHVRRRTAFKDDREGDQRNRRKRPILTSRRARGYSWASCRNTDEAERIVGDKDLPGVSDLRERRAGKYGTRSERSGEVVKRGAGRSSSAFILWKPHREADVPKNRQKEHILKFLTRKPIAASREEIARNPRSRSAEAEAALIL